MEATTTTPDFSHLTPDAVINSVEEALGVRCSNLCRPLNSYINRVYEVGLDTGGTEGRGTSGHVIAKFYRPGRWSREALQDELDFLKELHEAEVPVVPPLASSSGELLHQLGGTWFAVFPKRGGRPLDEPSPDDWTQLGRLIGRMHVVGAAHAPRDRIKLHPRVSTLSHLDFILRSGTLVSQYRRQYEDTVRSLVEDITPLFEDIAAFRIHADCHRGNILFRPGEGYHLLDFDDMAVGPAVQDLWMMLPDKLPHSRPQLDLLLDGYETFLDFPYDSLRLVEPLRAMHFIHFTAWCARQKADGGFARLAPDWGSQEFWRQDIAGLEKQKLEIETVR